jgi:hypothetical protein
MTSDKQVERMWKNAVVVLQYEKLSGIFLVDSEKPRKISVRVAGLWESECPYEMPGGGTKNDILITSQFCISTIFETVNLQTIFHS